ncbi:MAG: YlxR family protein [Firmicutes bacterium]|nr:YlxR family protein [Bacillota bacterium]
MGKQVFKPRKVPQRTCVGCQSVKAKKELIRIVRTPDGIIDVDATGKKSGRGAYLCADSACLDKAVKGKRLEKALGVAVDGELIDRVRGLLQRPSTKPEVK